MNLRALLSYGLTAILAMGVTSAFFILTKAEGPVEEKPKGSAIAALCSDAWGKQIPALDLAGQDKLSKNAVGTILVGIGQVDDGYCFNSAEDLGDGWRIAQVDLKATAQGEDGVKLNFERTTYNGLSGDWALYLPSNKCATLEASATAYKDGRVARWSGKKELSDNC